MKARDHPGKVVVALPERLQVQVAHQVHDLGENEYTHQKVIDEFMRPCRDQREPCPKGVWLIIWVQKVEGYQEPEKEAKVAHLFDNAIQGLCWFTVQMYKDTFKHPFDEMP